MTKRNARKHVQTNLRFLIKKTSKDYYIFRRFAHNCKKRLLASSCLSVRPHETIRLPLDEFSWNLVFEDFSKNLWRKFKVSLKSDKNKGLLYVKSKIHFWSYLVHSFLEWEIFQTKFAEKIKTHILLSAVFFRKSYSLWANVEKYCRVQQNTDDSMAHEHFMLDN
jgi:hypothetical protein